MGASCHVPSSGCTFRQHDGFIDWPSLTCFTGTDRPLIIVIAGALIYLVGLLCFFPDVITQHDEARYLETAHAFSNGSLCVDEIDPLTGEVRCRWGSKFLPGTSALMAPFVALFGWRGAYLVPALALVAATLCTGLWMRQAGRSPLFALMVLGYLPSLVLGRVAQSDLPSTALAALGLWLFWVGGPDRRLRWAASGFVAGLSLCLRETNALVFAPLYLGALIRRESGTVALVAGGVAGSLLWALGNWIVFGEPFFIYSRAVTFGLANVPGNLPLYTVALLLFVPAGLIGGLLYRGERWPEVVATVSIFCAFYLSFGYHGEDSGLLRSMILGPRYFAPLTPLLAFAAAEALPRLWASIRTHVGSGSAEAMARATSLGIRLWVVGVLIVAFVVHPILDRLTDPLERFWQAIYDHTAAGSVVVIPWLDRKLVTPMYGERQRLYFSAFTPESLDQLLARHGSITVALHDRRESSYLRKQAVKNQKVLDELMRRAEFELLLDWGGETSERFRIWRVGPPATDRVPPSAHGREDADRARVEDP